MAGYASPELWSDFDGTGVEIAKKYQPRNWSKYPLPMVEGYSDFLLGVYMGGVDIAGIVSRRPRIRRWVTERSVTTLGLGDFFPDERRIILAGSETKKAQHIITRSEDRVVGVADDKPHKIGQEILDLSATLGQDQQEPQQRQDIVLGAVNHGKTEEYMERLADYAADLGDSFHTAETYHGFHVWNAVLDLHVVPIEPYSLAAGQKFAKQITTGRTIHS